LQDFERPLDSAATSSALPSYNAWLVIGGILMLSILGRVTLAKPKKL